MEPQRLPKYELICLVAGRGQTKAPVDLPSPATDTSLYFLPPTAMTSFTGSLITEVETTVRDCSTPSIVTTSAVTDCTPLTPFVLTERYPSSWEDSSWVVEA